MASTKKPKIITSRAADKAGGGYAKITVYLDHKTGGQTYDSRTGRYKQNKHTAEAAAKSLVEYIQEMDYDQRIRDYALIPEEITRDEFEAALDGEIS